MPKNRIGGKVAYTRIPPMMAGPASPPPPAVAPVAPPTPQQIAQGDVLPSGGTAFDEFQSMTDDEKADVITNALGQALPVFLDDSGLQKLAYFTGLSETPTIMTESQINAMPGQDLWRSVHSSYDRNTDIGYTSKDIYNQIATGAFTRYSDTGGSAYGRGIYFDIRKGSYGSGRGYTVMHAKIMPGTKTISYNSLQSRWNTERLSGSKLSRAIMHADPASRPMIYAMAKGYSAVIDSGGYHMILNRKAIALSDTTF